MATNNEEGRMAQANEMVRTKRRSRKNPDKDPVFMAAITQMVLPLLFVRMKGCNAPFMVNGATFQGHRWDWDEYLQREEQDEWTRHDAKMDFEWSDWAWRDAQFSAEDAPARPRTEGPRTVNKHSRKRRITYFSACPRLAWKDDAEEYVQVGCDVYVARYQEKNGNVPRANPPGDRQPKVRQRQTELRRTRRNAELRRGATPSKAEVAVAIEELEQYNQYNRAEAEREHWDEMGPDEIDEYNAWAEEQDKDDARYVLMHIATATGVMVTDGLRHRLPLSSAIEPKYMSLIWEITRLERWAWIRAIEMWVDGTLDSFLAQRLDEDDSVYDDPDDEDVDDGRDYDDLYVCVDGW